MIKIALFLFVFIIPILGLSQSARKINKALKNDYAVQLHEFDSLLQAHDSIVLIHTLIWNDFKDIMEPHLSKLDILNQMKEKAIDTYTDLSKLQLSNSLVFSIKSLDSISLPDEIDKSYLLSPYIYNNEQDWSISLVDLSIKAQNELLMAVTNEIKWQNKLLISINTHLIDLIQTMFDAKPKLDLLNHNLNANYLPLKRKLTYLLEQKEIAENEFKSKGPIGFSPSYFQVFPSVFPDMVESERIDESVENVSMPNIPNIHEIYTDVDQIATFKGNLARYLSDNIHYPCIIPELGISGKCYLQFIVTSTGEITHVTVKRGITDCKECDDELVRVVKGMPNWNPAKNAGVAVDSVINLPISFNLPTE